MIERKVSIYVKLIKVENKIKDIAEFWKYKHQTNKCKEKIILNKHSVFAILKILFIAITHYK